MQITFLFLCCAYEFNLHSQLVKRLVHKIMYKAPCLPQFHPKRERWNVEGDVRKEALQTTETEKERERKKGESTMWCMPATYLNIINPNNFPVPDECAGNLACTHTHWFNKKLFFISMMRFDAMMYDMTNIINFGDEKSHLQKQHTRTHKNLNQFLVLAVCRYLLCHRVNDCERKSGWKQQDRTKTDRWYAHT